MLIQRNGRVLLSSTLIFCLIQFLLSVLIQTTAGVENTVFSFGSVVLCCLFCALLFTKTKDFAFTQLGLIFTVFADWFLVVMGAEDRLSAMICFSAVQIFYCLRLAANHRTRGGLLMHLAVRCTLVLLFILAAFVVLGNATDELSIVSVFYYANLILNVALAFYQRKKSLLFPIGLLLFILCDTVIGLNVMAELYIPSFTENALYAILNPGFNLAWVFYLPSQVLITLSTVEMYYRKQPKP